MSAGRTVGSRLGFFAIFLLLSLVTLGIYPLYFFATRAEEHNALLEEILSETKLRRGDG